MDKENIVEDSIRNNESKFIKSSVRIVENGMYSCNSYNKENNNGFDSKLIVIKNNVKIVENVGENVVENVMSRCGGESMYTTPPATNNSSHTPPLILNITNLLFLNKTNFAIIVVMVHKEDLWSCLTLIFNIMIKFDDAVAALRKSGAKSETVTICNVSVTDCKNWTRIALTLDKEVDGAVCDQEGNWSMGKTRVVFLSLYSILGLLKNTDETLAIASHVASHPTALQVILNGAKTELLQQEVKAHATYVNEFTGEETEYESDHDSLFNHLVSVEFTDKGQRAIEKIEDKLLGL